MPKITKHDAEVRGWPKDLPPWTYVKYPLCTSYLEFVAKYKITGETAAGVTGSVRRGILSCNRQAHQELFFASSLLTILLLLKDMKVKMQLDHSFEARARSIQPKAEGGYHIDGTSK